MNVGGIHYQPEAAVAQGRSRFVFTSAPSLMISQAIRDEEGEAAAWLALATSATPSSDGATKRAFGFDRVK